jgi:hypothetical protein
MSRGEGTRLGVSILVPGANCSRGAADHGEPPPVRPTNPWLADGADRAPAGDRPVAVRLPVNGRASATVQAAMSTALSLLAARRP